MFWSETVSRMFRKDDFIWGIAQPRRDHNDSLFSDLDGNNAVTFEESKLFLSYPTP